MTTRIPSRRSLAKQIKLLRFMRGWSQEQLAEFAGLHRTYISAIERGLCNLSLDNLDRLAQAFDLHAAELLNEPSAADIEPQLRQWRCEEPIPLYVVEAITTQPLLH